MKRLLLTLLLIVSGCGGGTTGTGGTGSSEYSGRLLDESGAPVANATVTIEETGDSAVTDANGDFVIESEVASESVTIHVQSEANDAKTTLDEIPVGSQSVQVNLQLDRRRNTVGIRDRTIRPRPTRPPRGPNNPDSTPTPNVPSPSASPVPTPVRDRFTIFSGTVSSSVPRLINRARVGIRGKRLSNVARNGTFQFREIAANDNNQIEVRVGAQTVSVGIDGVDEGARTVELRIEIEQASGGALSVSVIVANVVTE